jgi:hypothetical protein
MNVKSYSRRKGSFGTVTKVRKSNTHEEVQFASSFGTRWTFLICRRGRFLSSVVGFSYFYLSLAAWYEQFQKLENFNSEYGHSHVPVTVHSANNDYMTLATWCKHQRRQYNRYYNLGSSHSTLTAEQVRLLDSVQFGYPRGCAGYKTM